MWKYIVTYFLVIQTPNIKFEEQQWRSFDTRREAEAFKGIAAKIKYKHIILKDVVLDSVFNECQHLSGSITMVYCDPPSKDCNSFTCDKCGKVMPTY